MILEAVTNKPTVRKNLESQSAIFIELHAVPEANENCVLSMNFAANQLALYH